MSETLPDEVRALLERRAAARAERDWSTADRLRDALRDAGWEAIDGADGSTARPLLPASGAAAYADDTDLASLVGSSRVDLQACKLEYSIVSPK